ncbi:hypothetical protein, partial [Burkholderia cepacia]|uniref:hypothetical protein n=1 Tax=Burkholderia cepacia TaxID=292 RepID=UPI001FC88271
GTGTGGTAVSVDSGLTLSDGSSSTAKTATVKITNFQAGDMLNFVAQNGISSVYNTSTGTLTLSTGSGTATIAQWQAALESVTFSSASCSRRSAAEPPWVRGRGRGGDETDIDIDQAVGMNTQATGPDPGESRAASRSRTV